MNPQTATFEVSAYRKTCQTYFGRKLTPTFETVRVTVRAATHKEALKLGKAELAKTHQDLSKFDSRCISY